MSGTAWCYLRRLEDEDEEERLEDDGDELLDFVVVAVALALLALLDGAELLVVDFFAGFSHVTDILAQLQLLAVSPLPQLPL